MTFAEKALKERPDLAADICELFVNCQMNKNKTAAGILKEKIIKTSINNMKILRNKHTDWPFCGSKDLFYNCNDLEFIFPELKSIVNSLHSPEYRLSMLEDFMNRFFPNKFVEWSINNLKKVQCYHHIDRCINIVLITLLPRVLEALEKNNFLDVSIELTEADIHLPLLLQNTYSLRAPTLYSSLF